MATEHSHIAAAHDYTPAEMMAAVAARELRDGEVVFVGIGLPNLACNLARATHAPQPRADLRVGRGRAPCRSGCRSRSAIRRWSPARSWCAAWPTSSSASCRTAGSRSASSAARRSIATATSTRRWSATTRARRCGCPGSGGAAEIAIHARRTLVVEPAEPPRVSREGRLHHQPGPPHARAARGASWACRAPGPVKVITDKAMLEADAETGELVLAALYPGVQVEEVRAGVGWPLRVPRPARPGRSADRAGAAPAARRARSRSDSTSRADAP